MKTISEIKNEVTKEIYGSAVIPVTEYKFFTFQEQKDLTNEIAERYSDERLKVFRDKVYGTIDSLKITHFIDSDQHSEIIALIKDIQP